MSEIANIKANFANPSIDYGDVSISLEQEPWEDTTGLMKKSDFYGLISSLLNYNSISGTMDCGVKSNGDVKSSIYVYVYPKDLQYTLKTNYGSLGSKKIEFVQQTEVASFSVANTHSLGKIPEGGLSYKWIGKVYDQNGSTISPPPFSIDDRGNILLSEKVYGDLQLKYNYSRHKYNFKANVSLGFVSGANTATTGEAVNNLVAYAIWFKNIIDPAQDPEKGGIVWINLTPPPNSDANGSESADCGWYLTTDDPLDFEPPDDSEEEDEEEPPEEEDEEEDLDDLDEDEEEDDGDGDEPEDPEEPEEEADPDAQFIDKIITVDYCTQEVISESIQKRDPSGGSSSLTTF